MDPYLTCPMSGTARLQLRGFPRIGGADFSAEIGSGSTHFAHRARGALGRYVRAATSAVSSLLVVIVAA